MCASGILASFLSQVINAWPNKKLLDYSLFEQYKDIVPSILLSLVMGICVYLIGILLPIPTVLLLLVQVLIGGAVYIGLSVVFKIDTFYYILKLVKSLKNR